MSKPKESELLKLLNARAAWEGGPYKVPAFALDKVKEAAASHAKWNDSDPFAYARMVHYLRMGYELPSDILSDANRLLAQRGARAADTSKHTATLEPLKRRLESDIAWNQHKHKRFREAKAA